MSRKTLFQVAVIDHERDELGNIESVLVIDPQFVFETDSARARQRAFMMACEMQSIAATELEDTENWDVLVVPFN
jgi:hypothetical protein